MNKTQSFTTPLGKELTLKEYLTGREARDLKHAESSAMSLSFNMETQKPVISEVSAAKVEIKKEEIMITAAILSYDGSADNILDRLLDGPSVEYEFALAKANDVANPPKEQK